MQNYLQIYFKGVFYDKRRIIRKVTRRYGTSTNFQSAQSLVNNQIHLTEKVNYNMSKAVNIND